MQKFKKLNQKKSAIFNYWNPYLYTKSVIFKIINFLKKYSLTIKNLYTNVYHSITAAEIFIKLIRCRTLGYMSTIFKKIESTKCVYIKKIKLAKYKKNKATVNITNFNISLLIFKNLKKFYKCWNYEISFLRLNKVFIKNKSSKNRQNTKIIVSLTLLLNIIIINELHYIYLGITINYLYLYLISYIFLIIYSVFLYYKYIF